MIYSGICIEESLHFPPKWRGKLASESVIKDFLTTAAGGKQLSSPIFKETR
jgi:hypothetical protein